MKEKVAEETDVDWGKLKKVTTEGEEEAVVEEAVQLKKVEQESAEFQMGPRRQSVLVWTNVLYKISKQINQYNSSSSSSV